MSKDAIYQTEVNRDELADAKLINGAGFICEWFARCTNITSTVVAHPILGHVPCCQRCAEVVGMDASELIEINTLIERAT